MPNGEVSLISRVPHASDTLSGKVTPDTVFDPKDHRAHRNRDNMLDNFEKAETLTFLWARTPAARSARPRSPASSPTPRSRPCCRPCSSVDEVREYAAASDLPLTPTKTRDVDALWSRNFDHVDRYVMPLKSSV